MLEAIYGTSDQSTKSTVFQILVCREGVGFAAVVCSLGILLRYTFISVSCSSVKQIYVAQMQAIHLRPSRLLSRTLGEVIAEVELMLAFG